jgi:hypothetical protein
MIKIQGPLEQDFYYREEPDHNYVLTFYVNNEKVYSKELDYMPTQQQQREIFDREVKTKYPSAELV